ncbi:hypothetical protein [Paraglaciecola sp. 2405UD69-4]|uniref:hypothetical protein n=1 Tax=Paraglaciecola sp. 2405UD69-4 TaxID=3391836 RepID=UPI0039C8CA86
MIKNKNCVYCGKEVRKSNNSDDGRSVEHLIPQIAVSKTRTNAQGDFHVCRKCNTEKSKIDELFGLLSRINAPGSSDGEAISKLARMVNKKNKTVLSMVNSATKHANGVEVKLPFKGGNIYKYGVFLTKGEYFKKHRSLLSADNKIVLVTWGSPHLIKNLLSKYRAKHGTNLFEGLSQNAHVESIFDECFIIERNNGTEFLFIFNQSYLLITKVVDDTENNKIEKRINIRALIAGFSKNEKSKYCA